MGKTIVFANQKGGVGKTTTSVNLGSYIAESGKKVLLVDFDPQGNMSSSVNADSTKNGIYEVVSGKAQVKDTIQNTVVKNLDILTSNINLSGAGVELVEYKDWEHFLERSLATVKDDYDFIFIDSPPSLDVLTLNGLTAADSVIIPLQCEYFALEGLSLLLQTIKKVQKNINSDLKICGIVFTMYDSRTNLANEVVQEVSGYFKDKVFKTVIPRNIRLSEAPSHSVPINLYSPQCIGAKSYEKLAQEVLERV
ncbi:ParA family protein [Spirochaeta cellobiosiphila]|uniref:ParA family protein n=1 Tax=Spirochaeta cellobiosiphila TaxID=504483 RepID=UPI0004180060|nr:ParA family protein [Spirochaeta cellobiosiphila]